MEYYRSKCKKCGRNYSWIGYKCAWTPEQAAHMKKERTTCKYCGAEGLETDLDWGDNPATAATSFAAMIFNAATDLTTQDRWDFHVGDKVYIEGAKHKNYEIKTPPTIGTVTKVYDDGNFDVLWSHMDHEVKGPAYIKDFVKLFPLDGKI